MRRIVALAATLAAVFVAAAAFSATAWAKLPGLELCVKAALAGTGVFNNSKCTEKGGSKDYIRIVVGGDEVKLGSETFICVKVVEAGTGTYKNAECSEKGSPAEYIEVPPEFGFTIKTGPTSLSASGGEDGVDCSGGSGSGELVGETGVGKVLIRYTGCKSTRNEGATYCTVKSPGTSIEAGEILTATLMGRLGEVATREAESGTGIILLAALDNAIETLEKTSCTVETTVTGVEAGEVTPVGSLASTENFNIEVLSGKQRIRLIATGGGSLRPALAAFSTTAVLSSTDELSFSEDVEVT
jgi:hypothetical protein